LYIFIETKSVKIQTIRAFRSHASFVLYSHEPYEQRCGYGAIFTELAMTNSSTKKR